MQRARVGLISLLSLGLILLTSAFTDPIPLAAISLIEGRTYDQAHDTGYIDWSGPIQYVYLTHKDGSWLPPEEGGTNCLGGCQEWVTRISSGGSVSGSFGSTVGYFEVNLAMTHDSSAGHAVIHACSASVTFDAYIGSGNGLPGFVSMPLVVPSGCATWSVSVSGGYVDFRSIDVNYSAPPPTPVDTVTPVPSMTFTPTQTLTLLFTPTFSPTPTSTPTYTPSPTPTPLPPEITGQVTCDSWGEAGWCRGNESLDLSASDPQGYTISITGDLNGNPFTCLDSCSVSLPEGNGIANYTVTSASSQTASGTSTWKRDSTPPLLKIIVPPVDGMNGWYITEVDVSADASDPISGIDSVQGTLDDGATWFSLPIHLADEIYPLEVRARDNAGNETIVTDMLYVDTVPPVSSFLSPPAGSLVAGSVTLTGKAEDETSGPASGEISLDEGTTWKAVSVKAGGVWSYPWDTNSLPNGPDTLLMRSRDLAGNLGDAAQITLLVDNLPPSVSLTNRWWIWETGKLHVSSNYFPIASVKMTISDPQNRWPAVILNFDPDKIPDSVSWNRHFADGTVAPPGDYRVVVHACDVNGLCGSASGIIVIPLGMTPAVTMTSSPTATLTATATPQATPRATQKPVFPTAVHITPLPSATPVPVQSKHSMALWQVLGLLGLMLAISSASVIDPRPAALDRLSESINQISTQVVLDSSKDE